MLDEDTLAGLVFRSAAACVHRCRVVAAFRRLQHTSGEGVEADAGAAEGHD